MFTYIFSEFNILEFSCHTWIEYCWYINIHTSYLCSKLNWASLSDVGRERMLTAARAFRETICC